jgi:hypothetical protein
MAAATEPAAIKVATAPIIIPALLRAHDMRLSLTQPGLHRVPNCGPIPSGMQPKGNKIAKIVTVAC